MVRDARQRALKSIRVPVRLDTLGFIGLSDFVMTGVQFWKELDALMTKRNIGRQGTGWSGPAGRED